MRSIDGSAERLNKDQVRIRCVWDMFLPLEWQVSFWMFLAWIFGYKLPDLVILNVCHVTPNSFENNAWPQGWDGLGRNWKNQISFWPWKPSPEAVSGRRLTAYHRIAHESPESRIPDSSWFLCKMPPIKATLAVFAELLGQEEMHLTTGLVCVPVCACRVPNWHNCKENLNLQG